MALGFTVSAITDSKVVPDKTLTKQTQPRVRIQRFGDGYEQRIVDGINNITENYTLTFTNRSKTESDDIIAFFDTQAGVAAFNFTIPDTNSTSTTTSVTSGSTSNTTALTLTAANLDIVAGATVSGTGISGTPTVSSISGTSVVLSTNQSISGGVTLTFTNSNEKEIKVVCDSWAVTFSNKEFHNIQTTFRRVYEP